MNRKTKKILIILLAIIILSFMGVVIYERYDIKKDKKIINNYYSSEYLFNNGYIEKSKDIDDLGGFSGSIYMYLDKDNTLYIKDTSNNYNKQINGLPKVDLKVYYNKLENNCYELASLINNDLYYVNICLDDGGEYSFNKISDEITEIYSLSSKTDLQSKFIVNTKDSNLKSIVLDNDKYVLSDNIEKINPYFDYICLYDECDQNKIYITFDMKLVKNSRYLKDNDGNKIIIKDIFGIVDVESSFNVYIIDINNRIYLFKDNVLSLYSAFEVESVEYKNKDVFISYKGGKSETIKANNIIKSTIIDRNNIIK